MATIQRRALLNGRVSYRAVIRRIDAPTMTKTFRSEDMAKAWAEEQENIILDRRERQAFGARDDIGQKAFRRYPRPPGQQFALPRVASDSVIPAVAGVYIAYLDDDVAYVGESCNLRKRLTYAHPSLSRDVMLGCVLMPDEPAYERKLAEAYYSVLLRPREYLRTRRP